MLNNLKPQPADKILALMALYRDDPRPTKIDLGVGVYKNAEGVTPVMRAVKEAERRLVEEQTSKAYVALAGDPAYSNAMIELVLNNVVDRGRIAAVATPGGTGAVRQAFELIKGVSPDATVWVSNPTWPNHVSILNYLGMNHTAYRYFDGETRGVDFDGMIEDLAGASAGDVVLLHGCCHNPTGANLNQTQWQTVVDLLNEKGLIPMIDIAYQGFGDGLEEDAAATRLVASSVPECLIAASCSKNFGVYRERTGLLMAISEDAGNTAVTQGNLNHLNRQNFSFPPDHGARVVTTILTDDALRADWAAELEDTRLGMLRLREQLASELQRASGSDRFGFLAQHRGMFSRLGASADLVERLRAEHGIYMVSDSRLNIAGLNETTVPILAKAIVDTGI
ncbi:amino acid aminotransferase [Shimia thalassica]|uniref:amino acid aminotransferase n=1 Tax=Shimia thalassica TaxID=1715693 RepID=UPI000C06F547|nr:amino acid aminotransferase [Shimia thalassica]PHO04665.1 aromatic amino acid aminotransferase [Rhodobacteraceae bacterium 4F10]MBU2943351.1 aspartate/tyrosine/aromatic aminotransferase [Shimia thalassica]MDO6478846.1 amino acid aminotransferase [Shimia thalassica]MDO6484430.1 amino acid aminotransferase [Shimia thalassica]MDO6501420.1 amino acid aminotransferase [Shimia thalassica]